MREYCEIEDREYNFDINFYSICAFRIIGTKLCGCIKIKAKIFSKLQA